MVFDNDIVENTIVDLEGKFEGLKEEAEYVCMKMNDNKTWYLTTTITDCRDRIGQTVTDMRWLVPDIVGLGVYTDLYNMLRRTFRYKGHQNDVLVHN